MYKTSKTNLFLKPFFSLTPYNLHLTTNSGFTLIELILVAAVIGLLATIFVSTFPASQRRARDTIRRSDIKQYQTAMEVYANKNNGNYYTIGVGSPVAQCATLGLTNCPEDPKSPPTYLIRADSSQYTIWATFEQRNDSGNIQYFIACSTGRSGVCTTAPSGASCPAGCP